MIITKIEQQKNPERVNIYIDEAFAFGLSEEIRFKYSLKEKTDIEQDFIDNILKDEEIKKAFNVALKFLSYKQRSEKEIFDHLTSKEFDENIIYDTLDKCKYYNYIDDVAFATNFIKDKTNLKKLGTNRIKYELRAKGISDNIIEDTLVIDSDVEYEIALSLAEKRIKSYSKDDKYKKYSKLSGYLQRRGYDFQIISKVLKEVIKDD